MKAMSHPSATVTPAQRRITLLRHATAAADRDGDDRSRNLTAEGLQSATDLGSWMRQQTLQPERILCSPAARTRQTCDALQLRVPVDYPAALYLASAEEMLQLLRGLDGATHHVLVIAHNPGLQALATQLAARYVRENDEDTLLLRFPTCGLVSLSAPAANWAELAPQRATVDLVRFGAE